MVASKEEKLKYCVGCKDNFYNSNNDMGIKECWSLKTAKICKRYRIGWWVPMDKKENFELVTTLSCHIETGKNLFISEIPKHLK